MSLRDYRRVYLCFKLDKAMYKNELTVNKTGSIN
jgi:hypothetical protein